MAKRIQAKHKIDRRLGVNLWGRAKSPINKKEYTPESSIKVSCLVNNTGGITGAEVVQVYIGKPKSKVKRALKELKGFKKTNLKPAENSIVHIDIPVSSLAFYDETISDWNLEKGDYIVYVGNASDNISKKMTITIK